MLRVRPLVVVFLAAALMVAAMMTTTATARAASPTPTTAAPLPPPRAWILVDVDTGNVISGGNDHTLLPPASLTKVITALASSNLDPATPVTIDARAAQAPPDKIGLVQGQVWSADELFHALLISSANDAAFALADQVGGNVTGFQTIFARTAVELGMADHPVLMDPAGLDGTEGVDGGNLVSARDLAIAGRALLADPYLAAIVATPIYSFVGPGNVAHRLVSHNYAFLSTYAGAIGIKTGFTDRAGTSIMAAARRNGRTMMAVVMHSANPTTQAKALLDQGFATPVANESTVDQLPPVNLAALRPPTEITSSHRIPAPTPSIAASAIEPDPADPGAVASAGPHSLTFATTAAAVAFLLCLALYARHRRRIHRARSEPAANLAGAVPSLWMDDGWMK